MLQGTTSTHTHTHTHKSIVFLYNCNKGPKEEIKKVSPFIIASRRIKYLEITLAKEAKDTYTENYKRVFKEIKINLNKEKDIPCSWTGKFSIVKMAITTDSMQFLPISNSLFL